MTKVAVVGCGSWGKNLIRAFDELGVLCGVHDTDRTISDEMCNEVIAKYHNMTVYFKYGEILDSVSPLYNAVAIATPTFTHFELAKQALKANKSVFIEKPMAMNSKQAKELEKMAREKDLTLMVDHLLLYHPAVTEMLKLVKEGAIGKIRYIHGQRLGAKVRHEENVLWSLAPHDLSITLSLIGEEPEEIRASGKVYIEKDRHVEDVVFLELAFPSGTIAHFHFSWFDCQRTRKFTVVGENGSIMFDDRDSKKLHVYKGNSVSFPPVGNSQPLDIACHHFLDCVSNGRKPLTDGEQGIKVIRTLEKAQRCLDEER